MNSYQRWMRLNLKGLQQWGSILPCGRIPIQCISSQKVMFDSFADPESVMTVDFKQLSQIQRITILERLNQNRRTSFESVLSDLLKFGLPIPRSHIYCCGIKEWNYLC